jgi:hypothetical protein
MSKRLIVIVLSAMVLVAFIGCSKQPIVESKQAQAALETAKAAEADKYAPETFKAAQDTLASANRQKTNQDKKFVWIRSYDIAKETFIKAEALAKEAQSEAMKAKSNMKAQVESELKNAQMALDEANAALKKAKRVGKKNLKQYEDSLSSLTMEFAKASEQQGKGLFLEAKTTLDTVIQKATNITTELSGK